ncbi:uncharacterized protein LOC126378274 [Pectinophora gossypiella]|uniref:uncharacterized protein LOC126378274 n=1 Tax=Pectinophora gossypiella TaxID=13191 RepID=UPI00214E631D|nr:uncharacterized protein LOC126378274 [Pectinophora gossypiella]
MQHLMRGWYGGKPRLTLDAAVLERQVSADEALLDPVLGRDGEAASLPQHKDSRQLAVNVPLSDRLPYQRTLTDRRHPACGEEMYDAELPSVSVIIIFHNEPYSMLLRTIWSVVNSAKRDRPWFSQANFEDVRTGRMMAMGYPGQDPSSQLVYLKEIILVDDHSTLPELKDKLSHYVRTRLPPHLIRIIRRKNRRGVVQARLEGARAASGEVLVFLDAHCEAQPDWLRPLLQRIRDDPHAVVMPIIDTINETNFFYSAHPEQLQVGGFTFVGHVTWIDVSEREQRRRGRATAPTWSPTMVGGMFAIEREYFWQLGGYDGLMMGVGGENLEISFRIWQCGGTLEVIPCSRVGHVFPRAAPAPALTGDSHGINTARMAEVWMDDYKELFYLHRPDLRNNRKVGDVSPRQRLRAQLQCNSFEWYLRHVYPEKFIPVRGFGYGRFRNPASGLCLDTMQREEEGSPLGVFTCHDTMQTSQYLTLTSSGQLRDELRCIQLQPSKTPTSGIVGTLVMSRCDPNDYNQVWRYTHNEHLVHVKTGLCVELHLRDAADTPTAELRARHCRDNGSEYSRARSQQRWTIDYSERNGFGRTGAVSKNNPKTVLRSRTWGDETGRHCLSPPAEDPHQYDPTCSSTDSIYDRRHEACTNVTYNMTLPSASVIIVFHNERYSELLRTISFLVDSVLRDQPWFRRVLDSKKSRNWNPGYPGQDPTSPLVYLKEIILVDDNSTLTELKDKLSQYLRTRLPPDFIRIVRLPERVGKVNGRVEGARAATGSVLVFLEARCRVGADWLRPLLQRVQDAPHAVVAPVVAPEDMSADDNDVDDDIKVGGFTFDGKLTWIPVSQREQKRRGHVIAPTWSPTLAGGMFAVGREYFWQLGGYDPLLDRHMAAHLELSFRIWQCGGTLEVIPCSRVTHRPRFYEVGQSTALVAELWMDEYKELFYLRRPDLRNISKVGDVSSRQRLRAQLQCNSFEWYLRHVYPEKFIFLYNAVGYGR